MPSREEILENAMNIFENAWYLNEDIDSILYDFKLSFNEWLENNMKGG